AGREEPKPGAKLPFWAKMQHDLRAQGVISEPVPVVDGAGSVLPEVRQVLRSIARRGLVRAPGHLGRGEIFAGCAAAVEEGVRRIVITHREFPSQSLGAEDQGALAEMGALLERCFTTPHSGKTSWETIFDNIRATGHENSLITSDLGQPNNPPVHDGITLFADRLLDAGFSRDEVHRMVVENSNRLVGDD